MFVVGRNSSMKSAESLKGVEDEDCRVRTTQFKPAGSRAENSTNGYWKSIGSVDSLKGSWNQTQARDLGKRRTCRNQGLAQLGSVGITDSRNW